MNNNINKHERKLNPRENASLISILTFWWTLPIFLQGLKQEINESSLFKSLKEHSSGELGDKLEQEWIKEQSTSKQPSLYKALYRLFGLEIILYGGIFIFNEAFCKMSQPLALLQLLSEFENGEEKDGNYRIYLYTSIIVAASFLNAVLAHYYSFTLQHLGMKIRVACCSLIYRKTLRLSQQSIEKVSVGHIINLLSNDVNRFDKCLVHAHSLWFVPIETMIIVYILYALIGMISTMGVLVILLFFPIQAYFGWLAIDLRLQIAKKTDTRVQLMNEIISGIRIIKMYTWEIYFAQLVTLARKLEVKKIRNSLYVKGVLLSLTIFSTRLSIYFVVLANVILRNPITAKYIFVATSFYNVLKQCTSRYFTQAICQVGEARTSIRRIEEFLLNEEIETQPHSLHFCNNFLTPLPPKQEEENTNITLKDVSATWSSESPKKVLNKINLNFKGPQLIAITGPVGSGKSSLLKVLLRELIIEEGIMNIQGSISYCSQKPWLFAGSIQQNILFAQKLNNKKYQEVIQACCLVHDFAVLPNGDQTIIGELGVTLSGGQRARINLARTLYNDANIYLLDDPLSSVDENIGKSIFRQCFHNFLKDKCTILITHQTQYLENVSDIFWMNNGELTKFVSKQLPDTAKLVSSNSPQLDTHNNFNDNDSSDYSQKGQEINESSPLAGVNKNVYASYLKAGGNTFSAVFVLLFFLLSQISASVADYFIAYWLDREYSNSIENDPISSETYLYIYTAIISFMIVVTLLRSFYFFHYCSKVSARLHNNMFSKLTGASLHFFDTHSSGRILNRFSKDMGSADETVPAIFMDCIQVGLNVLGVSIILVVVKPWMLVINCIVLTVFYFIRKYYLITSCTLKRLEASTRSLVFAHVNGSLQGISTIRAFGTQKILQNELDDYQDIHSSAWFMFLSSSTAFGFWLDLICVLYIALVAFLVTNNAHYSGNIGLAITQAISLMGLFQFGMRQWSDLENQMVSVERIREYGKIEQESDATDKMTTSNWPVSGAIEFRAVSLQYPSTSVYSLRNLTFRINPKEKIGIIGRTGAGKSSIVATIFHLVDFKGDILIDDVSIKSVPLKTLRSQITVIPQESVLFSGTVRKNLDPFNEYTDLAIWEALAEVELKETVSTLPLQLEENMLDGGAKLSAGQIQLICLARAVLKNNKIIILDEATANLDPHTDRIIQKTIESKFKDCTLLTIAHRLDTVIDADRILVMDYGCVVEFDFTHLLLENKDSVFYKMVKQSKSDI